MKDTQNITLTADSLINNGIIISITSYEDAFAFSLSILETINQVLMLTDISDVPPDDIFTTIRTQIRILQSIDLQSEVDKSTFTNHVKN